ncbi:MAG TPA: S41 family peptidase [Actinomycetota bacterium]|nr:S41 family peptidase [Actinomycetota bacterium]
MRLIRDHDSYALGVAWPNLASEAARLAQGARRPADVYPTISTVLEYLDDPHGELVPPDERTTWTGRLHNMASMPTGRLVGVAGVLELPGLGFPPRSGRAKAYVHAAWRVLRSVHPADGWIIDLREDYGGDAIPMLAAVEPFLDCSRFLGFRDAAQGTTWFHVREGSVGVRGPRGTSTTLGAYGTPPPPIPGRLALLAGASTASSGEATLIALRCHQGASFMGEPTAGLTGSPSTFTLSDGAWLRLTTSVAVDGAGTVYGGTVEPDIPVEWGSSVTDDPVLDRAVRFLASF